MDRAQWFRQEFNKLIRDKGLTYYAVSNILGLPRMVCRRWYNGWGTVPCELLQNQILQILADYKEEDGTKT